AQLPESFQRHLAQSVRRHGTGVFYGGAQAAFARGGYSDATLAHLLPVEFPPREEERDPGVAVAIVVDTSSSMTGDRIDLAKQVARLAVKRLKPSDRVGIVEFYGAKTWAVPMQPAQDRIGIDRAIGRMQAIGATVLYPAIEEAYYGVK